MVICYDSSSFVNPPKIIQPQNLLCYFPRETNQKIGEVGSTEDNEVCHHLFTIIDGVLHYMFMCVSMCVLEVYESC